MVISSTLTSQLDDVQAPIPLSRTRPRSVPIYTARSQSSTPNPSQSPVKRPTRPKKLVADRPPFVNFASDFINPYLPSSATKIRSLSRLSRPKTRNLSRRTISRNQTASAELDRTSLNATPTTQQTDVSPARAFIISQDPVEISVADRAAYTREFTYRCQSVVENRAYRSTVNSWQASSLNHLILLISELAPNQNQTIDRLWLIFYWISQNIRYDLDGDLQANIRSMRVEEIFRSGKTSCHGYASIFQYLCDAFKVRCQTIEGYAKDYNYRIENPSFFRPNHTWNVVQFEQHWYFVDSAWGTGYIDGNHEYKTELKSFYFLTNPEQMIYDHLPEDSRWQLLSQTLSIQDYIRLPHVHSYYFVHSLKLISPHDSSLISFDTNRSLAEVFIKAPDGVHLTCSVKNDTRSKCLAQYDGNRQLWQCLLAPYKTGFHTLIIFATRLSATNVFKNVIELGVKVNSQDLFRRRTLPFTFEKFIQNKCQILSPLNGRLKHGTKVQIRCRIPNAIAARISLDGIWLDEVQMRNDLFKYEINVPEREVIVYGRFNQPKPTKLYDGLVRYLVEK